MQPKRDPNDRRYWPIREGGIGNGFLGRDRRTHPDRYRAIQDSPERSIVAPGKGMTPEGIRTRARLILERALDKVEDELAGDNPLPLKDLNATVAALGRIAGVQSTDVNVSGTVGHLHLDALRAKRMVSNEIAPTISPILLGEGAGDDATP